MEDAMDCLMSFPDFLYAFQTQFFYDGEANAFYMNSKSFKLYWCLQLKVTISNKIVETNKVTSENNTNKTTPPSPQFKVGCLFSAASSNSGTTLHGWEGGGGGRGEEEIFIFPF